MEGHKQEWEMLLQYQTDTDHPTNVTPVILCHKAIVLIPEALAELELLLITLSK